ncbi:Hypoxia up-regulated protein 1 [Nowakowskiella sp. JEL0407]|nr:Hypoxia up-regulated protein 1 [Nowakowskiella sp. JEL0407]
MRSLRIFSLTLLSLLFLYSAFPSTSASVIGIDYGTDWFKVSLVKIGVPLDIVLNAESKRKTQSIVTIRSGVRYFGSDAVSLAPRFPHLTFTSLKELLGKLQTDSAVAEYQKSFTNEFVSDSTRGTVAFNVNQTIFSVEELVAMQLAEAKRQAENYGGEKITGAVITVPPYFNQFERQAMLDAAELAGLKVFSLMNDETAVALNYAMGRKFTGNSQHHIFYDMGAGSTVASLVKFENIIVKDSPTAKNRSVPNVEVLAVGYDSSLGGSAIDKRLQNFLAARFAETNKEKLKGDVFSEPKAMTKLLKEANRVKQILSANTQCMSGVEHLMEEIDFKTIVTREELEDLCADLFTRIRKPIDIVLEKTGLKMEDINSLVLVGGGARVPKVQAILSGLVGEDKIAKNINADEAAVLGAGFRAAGLSRQFRVKEIRVKDIIESPIEVVYETESKEETSRTLRTVLFNEKSALGAKKLMNFRRETDFTFTLEQKDSQQKIFSAKVSGLTETVEKYKEKLSSPLKVKAFIEVTDSGLISIEDVHAFFEVEQSGSIKDTVMSFFKGKKEKSDVETPEEEAVGNENEKNEETTENKTNSTETASKKNETEKASGKSSKAEKVKLTVEIQHETVQPMTEKEKSTAIERLTTMDNEDKNRRAKEEARNVLESFLYSTKEFLYDDEVEQVTNEDQRTELKDLLEVTGDWLFDFGDSAPIDVLREKLAALKALHSPMSFRRKELSRRPAAVKALRSEIETVKMLLDALKKQNTVTSASSTSTSTSSESTSTSSSSSSASTATPSPEPLYSEVDFTLVSSVLTTAEDWLKTKEEEQSKLAPYESPVLKSKDIGAKVEQLKQALQILLSRKPKAKSSTKASSKTKSSKKTTTQKSTTTTTTEEVPTEAAETESVATEESESVESESPSSTPIVDQQKDEHDEL